MVQQQIVEYAKAQLAVGINEEVIKGALVQAGWPVADVDDSIKSISQKKAPEVAPVSSPASVSRPAGASTQSAQGSPTAQAINVKGLFGGAGKGDMSFSASPDSVQAKPDMMTARKVEKPVTMAAAMAQPQKSVSRGGSKLPFILAAVVAVAGIGGTIFFLMQSKSLSSEIDKLKADNASATSASSNAASQLTALQQAKDESDAKLASSTAEIAQLNSQFLFFVSPTVSTATVQFSLSGLLSVDDKAQYVVGAPTGLKVVVKNSKDEKVDAALKPLIGKIIEISGTHAKLSKDVTVTAVNGTSL